MGRRLAPEDGLPRLLPVLPVHNVGGVIVLGAVLGPGIGKYDKDGNPHAIPGHNLTAGALGVFILWFCWYGFNGALPRASFHR